MTTELSILQTIIADWLTAELEYESKDFRFEIPANGPVDWLYDLYVRFDEPCLLYSDDCAEEYQQFRIMLDEHGHECEFLDSRWMGIN